MKKKNTTAILFVLAILILGVVYAAASTTLTINGTLGATTDDANFKVKFTAATNDEAIVTSTDVEPVISTGVSADGKTGTFTVKDFTCKDDKVVLKYTIANESEDLKAGVKTVDLVDFLNKEYFSVVSSFEQNSTVTETTINAQDTATLYVTVTCIKTPVEDVTDKMTEGIVTVTATAK